MEDHLARHRLEAQQWDQKLFGKSFTHIWVDELAEENRMTKRFDSRDLRTLGAFAVAQGVLANPTLAASNSLKPANVVKLTDEILAELNDTDAFTATHIQLAHADHVLAGVKQQLAAADRLAADRGIQIDQMIESMKKMEDTEAELLLENKRLKMQVLRRQCSQ